MSGERVGFRFKHADPVVKRNPQGRSRRGWVMEPVEQTTSRGTKMPAYRIRWPCLKAAGGHTSRKLR